MNDKMIMMIGETGSASPSVMFPIGGDKFTASEAAVYLASHLKDGLTVKLEGDDVRLVLDSGRGATGENSGAGWRGDTMSKESHDLWMGLLGAVAVTDFNLNMDEPIHCPHCNEIVKNEPEFVEHCGVYHDSDFRKVDDDAILRTENGFCTCFWEVDCEHCGTRLNNDGEGWRSVP